MSTTSLRSARFGGGSLVLLACVLATTFLSSCGNDGGAAGGSFPAGSTGHVTLTIASPTAPDVDSFTVDVARVALRRTSGQVVELLASPARVDLASIDGRARLLSTSTVPAGTYVAGVLSLDATHAELHRAGASGELAVVDASGDPITTVLDLPITFATPIVVSPANPRVVEVGLDSAASLLVNAGGTTAAFEPALEVRVDPPIALDQLASGTITSVDAARGTVLVRLRGAGASVLASVSLRGANATTWHVDGVPLRGIAGLTALATLPVNTSIQAVGRIDDATGEFQVVSADAGSGALESTTSAVDGIVVGRIGGVGSNALLEVVGRSISPLGTTLLSGTTFVVRTDFLSTKVARAGGGELLDADDVNVGQRIRAHGLLSGTILDASGSRGVVILEPTSITGRVVEVTAGVRLTLDVARVDALDPTAIRWLDGGATPVDPHAVIVRLPTSPTSLPPMISVGTRLTVDGFFTGVDVAADDFESVSLLEAGQEVVLVRVRNRAQDGFALTPGSGAHRLDLAIAGASSAGESAVIDRGLSGVVALPTAPVPAWLHASDRGAFTLRDRTARTLRVYGSFAQMLEALDHDVFAGATILQVAVRGRYDRATNTFDGPTGSIVID